MYVSSVQNVPTAKYLKKFALDVYLVRPCFLRNKKVFLGINTRIIELYLRESAR